MRRLIAILLLLGASGAFAGAQIYEPLSASVQAALHKAVSDARPPSSSFSNPMDAVEWLAEMSPRLEKRIPNREYRLDLLRSVHYEATRAGLDPQLRRIVGRRPRLHAGHAVLGQVDRPT